MRRTAIPLITVITVLVVIFFLNTNLYNDYAHNRDEKKLWQEFSATIKEDKVLRVELVSDISVELTGGEKDDFIKGLRNAEFYRSNWRKEGPTGSIIMIVFTDGSKHFFQYWGGAVFETMYKNG